VCWGVAGGVRAVLGKVGARVCSGDGGWTRVNTGELCVDGGSGSLDASRARAVVSGVASGVGRALVMVGIESAGPC
jgi:hypothetical protein